MGDQCNDRCCRPADCCCNSGFDGIWIWVIIAIIIIFVLSDNNGGGIFGGGRCCC